MSIELDQPSIDALGSLREQAIARRLPLDAYLRLLAETGGNGAVDQPLSSAEMEHLLDALATGATLPLLPADFSRADIYAEHD